MFKSVTTHNPKLYFFVIIFSLHGLSLSNTHHFLTLLIPDINLSLWQGDKYVFTVMLPVFAKIWLLTDFCFCVCSQDHPRPHLQRSEAFHGDESEALWWLHTAVQGWEKQVGTADSSPTRFSLKTPQKNDVWLTHNCNQPLHCGSVGFHIYRWSGTD